MIPKHCVRFIVVIMACLLISQVGGRELKEVAPACSGSKCYTCSGEVAPVISTGGVCTCSDGTACTEVGSAVAANTTVSNAMNTANTAVSNAMNTANAAVANAADIAQNAVSNAMNGANEAMSNAADAASGASCPQHGDGQGGSRCGTVDLIGYCEDKCGSGDGACCTDNKPICAC